MSTFSLPWVIVARQSGFHRWVALERVSRIELAAKKAEQIKASGRWYAVQVRAA